MKLLKQIVETVHDKTVAISLGAGVDPDGLASQLAMSWIVKSAGGKPVPYFKGTFNRPQNRTMRQELGLNPIPIDKMNFETCGILISVDGPVSICPRQPEFVIDHHQRSGPAKIADDIRQVGSCSAIMWEYLMEAGLDWTSEEGTRIATALVLGIMTDTKNGSIDSASELDFDALSHCMKHKDNNLYKKISNYPKPSYWHDLYATAWSNRKEHGAVLVAGIGNLTSAQSGVISDLAEKFCETEGVTTSVVFAMVEGNVDISVRSTNSSLDVDEFVKHAFGGGGGKRGAGRCRLDIPLFQTIPDAIQDKLFEAISETIVHKALQFANDGIRVDKTGD